MTSTYRMPAEWEKQRSVWLLWPHQHTDWPGKFEPIPWVWTEIIRHIVYGQKVSLIVRDAKMKAVALKYLKLAGIPLKQIEFVMAPSNRAWARDSGAIFVQHGKKKVALDWRFNGWAKYVNHKYDDQLPVSISQFLKVERVQPMHRNTRVVLEGGAIDVNGKGALLTTEECLLSKIQERNPGFKKKDYESIFKQYLGISHTVWLNNGIVGDDTHGHVDDLARFTDAGTIAIATESNPKDANYSLLKDNLKRLNAARDQNGKPFTIIELPMPRPIFFEGQRLPASYANFLITNKTVIVPTFNDPADRIALSLLEQAFPTRDVVGLHSVDLVWGLGTIHCLSQQEPLIA